MADAPAKDTPPTSRSVRPPSVGEPVRIPSFNSLEDANKVEGLKTAIRLLKQSVPEYLHRFVRCL